MEQRTYHGGDTTPDSLAEYLVQMYAQDWHWTAQKLGAGRSLVVQIGRNRYNRVEPSITLGITHPQDDEQNIIVTMGEQNWIDPTTVTGAAMRGLIGLICFPWAIFAMLYPLRRMLDNALMPGQLWNRIDTFVVGQGGVLVQQQDLKHPHGE